MSLQYGKAMTVAKQHQYSVRQGRFAAVAGRHSAAESAERSAQPAATKQTPANTGFTLEQEAKEDVYYPWLGGQQEGSSYYSRGVVGRPEQRAAGERTWWGGCGWCPDRRSNTLLVTCNVHFFPQIMKLVNELDAPTAQVLIGAKIIEVSSDFRDKLGRALGRPPPPTPPSPTSRATIWRIPCWLTNSASYTKTFVGNSLASSLANGVLSSKLNLGTCSIQFSPQEHRRHRPGGAPNQTFPTMRWASSSWAPGCPSSRAA